MSTFDTLGVYNYICCYLLMVEVLSLMEDHFLTTIAFLEVHKDRFRDGEKQGFVSEGVKA